MTTRPHPDTGTPSRAQLSLLAALSEEIRTVLEPLLPEGSTCCLLDFPSYSNVGDSAIWLGEIAYLERAGVRVVYRCDIATCSLDELARRLGAGTILLSGGGNSGDLYPAHQRFRETIIRAFPNNRIIQLPQTIHFADRSNLARARAIIDAHPYLTFLVRDQRSLDFARNEFRAQTLMCPDMAFALGLLNRPVAPSCEVLWLARTDVESLGSPPPRTGPGIQVMDWVDENPTALGTVHEFLTTQITRYWRLKPLTRALARTFAPLAKQRLARGCRILSSGRVVITDRLHGHILSLLLGIPHVLLDNSYGKVRSFYESWTKSSDHAVWANSPREALERARSLAAAAGSYTERGFDA